MAFIQSKSLVIKETRTMPKAVKTAKYMVRDLFQETFREMDGKIIDSTEARGIVYARATVPRTRSVRKGDEFFGGVAMRASDAGVSIHPFTFRVVCSNGAVMSRSRLSRSFEFDCEWDLRMRFQLRQAFEVCASEPAFEESIASVQSALDLEVDMAMMMMDLKLPTRMLRAFLERFIEDRESNTAYGWMNAVTATARTVRDPEERWELEKLGAMIPFIAAEKRAVGTTSEMAIA